MPPREALPVIYSCSGCSSAAEAADRLARRMDRLGLAEMSCIAGVGGKVTPLVNKARQARQIVALDGCPLSCAKACLAGVGITPDVHVELSDLGVGKRLHSEPSALELELAERVVVERIQALRAGSALAARVA
jgi:uncharacterized metal-binding protein